MLRIPNPHQLFSGSKAEADSGPAASIPAERRVATVYTTARDSGHRLARTATLTLTPAKHPGEADPLVLVDPDKRLQTLAGIGGAITDAVAETFALLPETVQEELLRAYFHVDDGIGYTLIRTSIHSCDFSSASYTYTKENDRTLATFSVEHDQRFRLPLLRRAIAAAGGTLAVLASPWSPPAWMKNTGSMPGGGSLLPDCRQLWANYMVRFLQDYENAGVPIWGLTVQNEPMAVQRWESCLFTAEEERDFIREFLGPSLESNGLDRIRLIAWDHNRDLIYHRASVLLSDPDAVRFIWGIGYHWYETWTGGGMQFENVRRVREAFPAIHLLLTEACVERFDAGRLDDWSLGERYGHSMINDFNAGAVAWLDWNILLNETGGPNHVGNYCFAPVIADTRSGLLHYTNSYFYLGHFSKFIRPGARRIVSSSNRDALQTTAFVNLEGDVVVVILNTTDQPMDCTLWIQGRSAGLSSLAHSIITLVL